MEEVSIWSGSEDYFSASSGLVHADRSLFSPPASADQNHRLEHATHLPAWPTQYFVIGDNRESSFFAKVQKHEIIGRIVF